MNRAEQIRQNVLARMDMTRTQLGMKCEQWCAEFVSQILTDVGITGVQSVSCNEMKKKMTESVEWTEPETAPESGDVIFFDWDLQNDPEYNTRPLDHVGIVDYYDPDTQIIHYINGNGASPVYVTEQAISIHNPCVAYWMRVTDQETPKHAIDNKAENLRMTIEKCKNVLNELLILLSD